MGRSFCESDGVSEVHGRRAGSDDGDVVACPDAKRMGELHRSPIAILGGFSARSGVTPRSTRRQRLDASGLVYSDLEFWGWFYIVIGALQILTALLLFARRSLGLRSSPSWATSASALIAFWALLANTDWALAILALDVIVLWSVFANIDDFSDPV